MNKDFYPLSQLRFEITSIICTNGGSLKCFSGGRTESEPRIVHEHEWVLFLSDGGKTKIDDEVYEIECPACNDTIYLDADMLEEEGMVCPNCGTDLEFDFDGCDCECCDCGSEETEE